MKTASFPLKRKSSQLAWGLAVFYFSFLCFHVVSAWDDIVTFQSEIEYSIEAEDVDHSPARHHQNFRIRSSTYPFSRLASLSFASLSVKFIYIPLSDTLLTKQTMSIFFQLSSHWDYSTLFRVFRI